MRCGISSDSAEMKLLHVALNENVNAEDSGGVSSAGTPDVGENSSDEGNSGGSEEEGKDPLKGDVSKLDFGAATKSIFSIAAAGCAQGIGKALASILSSGYEDEISMNVTASLMNTAFQVSTMNGV